MPSYIQNPGNIMSFLESPLPMDEKIKKAEYIFFRSCKLPPELKEQVVMSWVTECLQNQELSSEHRIALWDLLLTFFSSKRLSTLFSHGFLFSLPITFIQKLPILMKAKETSDEILLSSIKFCIVIFETDKYTFQANYLLKYMHPLVEAIIRCLENNICMPPLILLRHILNKKDCGRELVSLINNDLLYVIMNLASTKIEHTCSKILNDIKEDLLLQVFTYIKGILLNGNAHKLLEQSKFFFFTAKCNKNFDKNGLQILHEYLYRMCDAKNHHMNFYILHEASRMIFHDGRGSHHPEGKIRQPHLSQESKDMVLRTILQVADKIKLDLSFEYKGILIDEWIGNIGRNLLARQTFTEEGLISLKLVCKISPKFVQDENLLNKMLSSEKHLKKNYCLYMEVLTEIVLAYDRMRDLPKFIQMMAKTVLEIGGGLKIKYLPVNYLTYADNYVIPCRFMVTLGNCVGQLGSQQSFTLWIMVKKILNLCLEKLNTPDISHELKSSVALVVWICTRCLGATPIHPITNVSTVPRKLYQSLQDIATECILPLVNLLTNFSSNGHLSTALLQLLYIWGEIRIKLLSCPEFDGTDDLMGAIKASETFDFSVQIPFISTDTWKRLMGNIICSDTSVQNCLNQLIVQKLALATICKLKFETDVVENHETVKKIKLSHTEGKVSHPKINELSQMQSSCKRHIMNCFQSGSAENRHFLSLCMPTIIPNLVENDLTVFSRLILESSLGKSRCWVNFLSSPCFQNCKSLHFKIFDAVCANLQASIHKKSVKKKFSLFCSSLSNEVFNIEKTDILISDHQFPSLEMSGIFKEISLFGSIEESHLLGLLCVLSDILISSVDYMLSVKIINLCLCIVVSEINRDGKAAPMKALSLMTRILTEVQNSRFLSTVHPLSLMQHLQPACSVLRSGTDRKLINYALLNNDVNTDADIGTAVLSVFKISIKGFIHNTNNSNRLSGLAEFILEMKNVEHQEDILLFCSLILLSELRTEFELCMKDRNIVSKLVSTVHSMRGQNKSTLSDITCLTAYIIIFMVQNENSDVMRENVSEETLFIKSFISKGKEIALLHTKDSHDILRQIANTFLSFAVSWDYKWCGADDSSISKIKLDDVIWDVDPVLAVGIIDSLPQFLFEQIARKYYYILKDSNQCDKLAPALHSWNKLVKLKLSANKKTFVKIITKNLLCRLMTKLQNGALNYDLCVKSLELHLEHCKRHAPEAQVESLVSNFIIEFNFENYQFPEFIQVFSASTQSLMYYVRTIKRKMAYSIVAINHTIISLAKGLMCQSSQEKKRSSDELKELEVCCQNLNAIISEVCHANEPFVEVAHYLVEGLINCVQKTVIYPTVKMWMESSIIQIFKVIPDIKLQYLSVVMPVTQVTYLKYLFANYTESCFNIFL